MRWSCSGLMGLVVVALARAAAAAVCMTDSDCQLNGVCRSGVCDCDAAWDGATCGQLAFDGDGALAYGGPNALVTSWGGGPPVFDEDSGAWTLFLTEIGFHCGLDQWQRYSTVVAATGSSPAGPFTRSRLVIPQQAHNPYYAWDASSGTHLIYHIGAGTGTGQYNSSLRCANGTTPGPAGAAARSAWLGDDPVYSAQPNLHAARSLKGPFVPVNFTLPPGHAAVGWGNDNPAPWVFENGTVLMLSRKYNGTAAKLKIVPHDTIWLVRADSFRGPYTLVHDEPLFSDYFKEHAPFNEEDPVLWRDARGHFHALFHFSRGHAWSEDGMSWRWGGGKAAWTTTVSGISCDDAACRSAAGHVQTVRDAERPRLWINASTGQPELFFVASGGNSQPSKPGLGAKGFTVVQRIRTKKPV